MSSLEPLKPSLEYTDSLALSRCCLFSASQLDLLSLFSTLSFLNSLFSLLALSLSVHGFKANLVPDYLFPLLEVLVLLPLSV